jgi:hypothetical protein
LHLPAQLHAEQIAHADDLLVEIDVLRLKPLLAGEGKECSVRLTPRSAAARISSTPPDRADRANCVTIGVHW